MRRDKRHLRLIFFVFERDRDFLCLVFDLSVASVKNFTEFTELTGTVQVAYCLSYLLLTPCWDNHSSNVVLHAESGTLTLCMLTGSGFPSSIQTLETMCIQRNPLHLTHLPTHSQTTQLVVARCFEVSREILKLIYTRDGQAYLHSIDIHKKPTTR